MALLSYFTRPKFIEISANLLELNYLILYKINVDNDIMCNNTLNFLGPIVKIFYKVNIL